MAESLPLEARMFIERYVVAEHRAWLLQALDHPPIDPDQPDETDAAIRFAQRIVGNEERSSALGSPIRDFLDLHDQIVAALRPETVECIEGYDDETDQRVLTRLRELGADEECVVLWAPTTSLRGRQRLRFAIRDVMGFQPATLVACIPGQLYFIEDFADRHLVIAEPTV